MIREGVGATYRRTLDLLAGWCNYVSSCAENAATEDEKAVYEAEADAIQEVYQLLGCASGPYADLDRLAEETMKSTALALVLAGAPRTDSAKGADE